MPELRLKSRSSAGASPLRQKSRSSAGANKTAEWTVPQIPLKTRARWQVPKIPGALRPKLVMKLTDALEWTDMEARAAAAEGERLMTEFASYGSAGDGADGAGAAQFFLRCEDPPTFADAARVVDRACACFAQARAPRRLAAASAWRLRLAGDDALFAARTARAGQRYDDALRRATEARDLYAQFAASAHLKAAAVRAACERSSVDRADAVATIVHGALSDPRKEADRALQALRKAPTSVSALARAGVALDDAERARAQVESDPALATVGDVRRLDRTTRALRQVRDSAARERAVLVLQSAARGMRGRARFAVRARWKATRERAAGLQSATAVAAHLGDKDLAAFADLDLQFTRGFSLDARDGDVDGEDTGADVGDDVKVVAGTSAGARNPLHHAIASAPSSRVIEACTALLDRGANPFARERLAGGTRAAGVSALALAYAREARGGAPEQRAVDANDTAVARVLVDTICPYALKQIVADARGGAASGSAQSCIHRLKALIAPLLNAPDGGARLVRHGVLEQTAAAVRASLDAAAARDGAAAHDDETSVAQGLRLLAALLSDESALADDAAHRKKTRRRKRIGAGNVDEQPSLPLVERVLDTGGARLCADVLLYARGSTERLPMAAAALAVLSSCSRPRALASYSYSRALIDGDALVASTEFLLARDEVGGAAACEFDTHALAWWTTLIEKLDVERVELLDSRAVDATIAVLRASQRRAEVAVADEREQRCAHSALKLLRELLTDAPAATLAAVSSLDLGALAARARAAGDAFTHDDDAAKLGVEVGDAAVALLVTAVSALAAAPPPHAECDAALAHVLDVLGTTLVRANTGAPSDADWRRFVRAGGETRCFELLTSHGAYENTFALCTRATLDIAEVASRGHDGAAAFLGATGMLSASAALRAHAADPHVAAAGARLVQRLVARGTQVAACAPLHEALVATQRALPLITDTQADQADTDSALSALACAVSAMLSGDSAAAVIRGGAPCAIVERLARERCAAVRATEAAVALLAALPAGEVIIECGLARTALETLTNLFGVSGSAPHGAAPRRRARALMEGLLSFVDRAVPAELVVSAGVVPQIAAVLKESDASADAVVDAVAIIHHLINIEVARLGNPETPDVEAIARDAAERARQRHRHARALLESADGTASVDDVPGSAPRELIAEDAHREQVLRLAIAAQERHAALSDECAEIVPELALTLARSAAGALAGACAEHVEVLTLADTAKLSTDILAARRITHDTHDMVEGCEARLVGAIQVLASLRCFDAPAAALVASVLRVEKAPPPARTAQAAFEYFTLALFATSDGKGEGLDEDTATRFVEHASLLEAVVCAMRTALTGEGTLGDGTAAQRERLTHWSVHIAGARIISCLSAARGSWASRAVELEAPHALVRAYTSYDHRKVWHQSPDFAAERLLACDLVASACRALELLAERTDAASCSRLASAGMKEGAVDMASCWPLLATVLKFTAENPSLRMHTRAALALIERFQLAQKAHADAAPPFSGRHPSRVAPHVPLQKLGAISMLAAVARTLEASARAPAGEDCDADGIADDAAAGDAHLDVESGAAQHDERSEFALAEAASIIGERLAVTITLSWQLHTSGFVSSLVRILEAHRANRARRRARSTRDSRGSVDRQPDDSVGGDDGQGQELALARIIERLVIRMLVGVRTKAGGVSNEERTAPPSEDQLDDFGKASFDALLVARDAGARGRETVIEAVIALRGTQRHATMLSVLDLVLHGLGAAPGVAGAAADADGIILTTGEPELAAAPARTDLTEFAGSLVEHAGVEAVMHVMQHTRPSNAIHSAGVRVLGRLAATSDTAATRVLQGGAIPAIAAICARADRSFESFLVEATTVLTSLARNTEAAREIVDAALASVLRTVCGSPDMLALAHAAFELVRRVLACGVTPARVVAANASQALTSALEAARKALARGSGGVEGPGRVKVAASVLRSACDCVGLLCGPGNDEAASLVQAAFATGSPRPVARALESARDAAARGGGGERACAVRLADALHDAICAMVAKEREPAMPPAATGTPGSSADAGANPSDAE